MYGVINGTILKLFFILPFLYFILRGTFSDPQPHSLTFFKTKQTNKQNILIVLPLVNASGCIDGAYKYIWNHPTPP